MRHQQNSELQREAEQAIRNQKRLLEWEYKMLQRTGRLPERRQENPARSLEHQAGEQLADALEAYAKDGHTLVAAIMFKLRLEHAFNLVIRARGIKPMSSRTADVIPFPGGKK